MNGKWIIRITLSLAALSAFFWCTWSLFAPIPCSPQINLPLGRCITALPRSSDFLGILILGWIWWSVVRQEAKCDGWLKQIYRGATVAVFIIYFFLTVVMFISYNTTGVFAASLETLAAYLSFRFIMWLGQLFFPTVAPTTRNILGSCCDFCQDFVMAFRKAPKSKE